MSFPLWKNFLLPEERLRNISHRAIIKYLVLMMLFYLCILCLYYILITAMLMINHVTTSCVKHYYYLSMHTKKSYSLYLFSIDIRKIIGALLIIFAWYVITSGEYLAFLMKYTNAANRNFLYITNYLFCFMLITQYYI